MRNFLGLLPLLLSVGAFAKDPCTSVSYSKAEYDASGKFKGCKLSEVEPDSLYAKLGLKPGEIVSPNSSENSKAMQLNDRQDCRNRAAGSKEACQTNDDRE